MVLVLPVGAGEGKASLLGRKNTVHQKGLFFHTRAEMYVNTPWYPFSLKISTLILWSTIASGRVSTFQSPMRCAKAALLPNGTRRPGRCSHFPGKKSDGAFLSSAGEAFYHHGNRQHMRKEHVIPHTTEEGTHPCTRQDRERCAILKSHLPQRQNKTTQKRARDPNSRRCWIKSSARQKPLPRPARSAADCALNHSEGSVLFGQNTQPASFWSARQEAAFAFSAFTSPFKQSPTNLDIVISPPHRASNR